MAEAFTPQGQEGMEYYAAKEAREFTMSNQFVLDNLLDRLREVKKQEGILHISEIKLGGKHPLTHYSEVTNSHKTVSDLPLFLYDDLFVVSNDLVHFTSFLYLLRPYINNPSQEGDRYFRIGMTQGTCHTLGSYIHLYTTSGIELGTCFTAISGLGFPAAAFTSVGS